MSQHSISRRQFLLVAGGTAIASGHLGGCHVAARTVLIRIAPRLGKIFSVLLNIADAMLTIDAIIDAVQRTHTENVSRQEVINLSDGAQLIIQDGSGKQFLVSFDLLNGSSASQNNSPYSRPTDERQRPPRLQNIDGDTQRIHFSRGATSASVNGFVESNNLKRYLLRAKAGQMMTVSLASKFAKFDVYFQKRGNLLANGTNYWQGTLPYNGDYVISIFSYSNDNFELDVSIV